MNISEVKVVRQDKQMDYNEFISFFASHLSWIYFNDTENNLTLRIDNYEYRAIDRDEYNQICKDVIKRLCYINDVK